MAPGKGGGSHGEGDSGVDVGVDVGDSGDWSSSCNGCSEELLLSGSDWENTDVKALFAIEIITCVVLVICLVLTAFFKWRRRDGTRMLRKWPWGYVLAVCSMLVFFIADIVDIALNESNTVVMYWYFILYIFQSLAWRLGSLLILAIIFRIIHENLFVARNDKSTLSRFLPVIFAIVLAILGLLSAAAFGLYIVQIVNLMISGSHYTDFSSSVLSSVTHANFDISVTYDSMYLLCAILILTAPIRLFVLERSRPSAILGFMVAPSLFLYSLIEFLTEVILDFSTDSNTPVENWIWAYRFINALSVISLFLGVAIFACFQPPATIVEHKSPGISSSRVPERELI